MLCLFRFFPGGIAPLGLLAYFAATVVDTGAQLATAYLKVFWVYYVFAAVYFFGGFTLTAKHLTRPRHPIRRLPMTKTATSTEG